MKQIKFLLMAVLAFASMSAIAHDKTDSVKVYGNCGMCKTRIEKAAKLEGVKKAEWNKDTKILTVTYDPHKVKLDDIQKNIAAVGHDTDKYSAEADVYKKLPGCCLYERKKADKPDDHSGHNH